MVEADRRRFGAVGGGVVQFHGGLRAGSGLAVGAARVAVTLCEKNGNQLVAEQRVVISNPE